MVTFMICLTAIISLHLNIKLMRLVKIPSDCPLIDPQIIDQAIGYYLKWFPEFDFVSNLHPASFPDGNDVEIMSFAALKSAWENANRRLEREHTTPFIWENPEKFRIGNVGWNSGKDLSTEYRWTIDYEEDYLLISEVYNRLFPVNPDFSLDDILLLLDEHPDISLINEKYVGKYWYENHLEELHHIEDYKNKLKKYEH